jgi:hypothetical protein
MRRVAKKNLLKRVGAAIAFLFGCSFSLGLVFCLYAPTPSLEDNWTLFRRKLKLPGVEADFDDLVDDMPHSEADTALTTLNADHDVTLKRGIQWGLGCITGSTITIYGSTRDFEAIATEYEALFANREDWTEAVIEPDWRKYVHESEKAVFDINLLVPSGFGYPPECEGYPTCYSTELTYADPSLLWCFG